LYNPFIKFKIKPQVPMFYVLLLYALFASVFTIAKTGLDYSEPLFFIGTRMLFAGLLLLGYQKFIKKESFTFDWQVWRRIAQLAIFNIYLTNAFEFWGLKHLTSFKTCFIYSLSPFISALISYWMFSEKLSIKKCVGLIIGFAGFLPILFIQTGMEGQTESVFFFSWAELSVMSAVVCGVYGWIVLRQLVNENNLSPLNANGLSMAIGGILALGHSFLTENWNPFPVTNSTIYIECTLGLIIISNLICYNLYGFLLKKHSATFISFAGLTTPLFSAFFGWFFLGEMIAWPFYVSFATVCTGLFIFDQEKLRQDYQVEKSLNAF
jgi:drug/metabolite transporter (DMT)-like permease